MPTTGIIKGSSHTEVKLSQTPLLAKSEYLLKICDKFVVFPSVINWREFTLPKFDQHQSMDVKWTGITNQQAQMINST